MKGLIVWKDKKRILGIPISSTNYLLNMDKLVTETGVLTKKEDLIPLSRIREISINISLCQKIFNVGTVTLKSYGKSSSSIVLKNVKNPKLVAQVIHESIEKFKNYANQYTNISMEV